MKKTEIIKIVREQIKINRSHQEIRDMLLAQGVDTILLEKTLKGFASKDFREKFSTQNHILITAFVCAVLLRTVFVALAMIGSLGDTIILLTLVLVLIISWAIVLWLVSLLKYYQFDGYVSALILTVLSVKGVVETVQEVMSGSGNVVWDAMIYLSLIIFAVIASLSIMLLVQYNKDRKMIA